MYDVPYCTTSAMLPPSTSPSGITAVRRAYALFFSSLLAFNNEFEIDQEVDRNAKQQSEMMVKSIYFGALAKAVKDNKVVNRTIKFRVSSKLFSISDS